MLSLGLRLKIETSMAVIVACAVLQNICVEHNEDLPPCDPATQELQMNDLENIQIEPENEENVGNARTYLVNDYFPHIIRN